ncbi:esterase FE4-like [Amyelois transitella]|uniref:esterase FE4-like n=1 Tax=Amyelois transitella TaxID=680683 RepID=UPI00067E2258|nr:esterase FE4-like [Amyelois transitella]
MGPIIEINQGKLEGIQGDNEFIFRGIPYAKPPIGRLRFSDPLPPEPWVGIRDATKPCNICSQLGMLATEKKVTGNEDCLYLNICTPELPSASSSPRPVLVFIHGGGFIYGNGTDYEEINLHGSFIERGFVVVTLNYRLGVLGFLSLDLKEAPGNMGLKDQCLALKWVQNNISRFGGNPNDVTIYGISAGAASVEYQVLSPMSRGLFHKAIAQSGSSISPWAHTNIVKKMSRKITALKGKKISNDLEMLKFLREMPIEDLLKTVDKLVIDEETPGGVFFGFCPCIEKPNGWQAFLEESQYELLKRGDFAKVPYLTSFCTREGMIVAKLGPQNLQKLENNKNFGEFLKAYFPMDDVTAAKYDERFKKVYLSLDRFSEPDEFAIEFFSDFDFFAGIYQAAKLMSKHNPRVYFYEFAYDGNLAMVKKALALEGYKGTCHGDDWGYIVKSTEQFKDIKSSKADIIASQRLLSFYTNFIKHGKPITALDDVITTHWEPVTASNMNYLLLNEDMKMENHPYPERMALFEEIYEKYYGK